MIVRRTISCTIRFVYLPVQLLVMFVFLNGGGACEGLHAASRNDVKVLLEKLKPPARFSGHKPDFSVETFEHAFAYASGTRTKQFFAIKDGPRFVALIPVEGGTIRLLGHTPKSAPRKLALPSHRITLEQSFGTLLRTDAFIPSGYGNKASSYEFSGGGERLILVRRFSGTASFNKWSHRSSQPETVDETNTFVFRCDPVLGYVLSATFATTLDSAPGKFEYFSAATTGICNVWYDKTDVGRAVFTPAGRPGYEGWGLNFAAIDSCDRDKARVTCRDGGFGGYLNRETGWSPVYTIHGAEPSFVVCNAHADLDFVVPWTERALKNNEGRFQLTVATEVLALPPEITAYVWNEMSMFFDEAKRVMIRIGRTEDFEDQPLALTGAVRALTSTGGGPRISTKYAHSGTKSIVLPHGRFWPNLPQVPLEGGAVYRLSAWIRFDPWTDDERAVHTEKAQEKIARRKAAGKKVNPFAPVGKSEAYITAATYISSPHQKKWERQFRTNAVTGGSWQQVSLELTAEDWGPFLNIVFVTTAGTAYLDDFELVKL